MFYILIGLVGECHNQRDLSDIRNFIHGEERFYR
jgi:hypothetical protein